MTKKIEDYLPYYIGQEVEFEFTTITGRKENRVGTFISFTMPVFVEIELHGYHKRTSSSVKLRLRPLSDMTPVEHEEFASLDILRKYNKPWDGILKNADTTHYLLKQGFDLFGLIEAGLAVDKTKEVNHATN